jgi:hypothetical protein
MHVILDPSRETFDLIFHFDETFHSPFTMATTGDTPHPQSSSPMVPAPTPPSETEAKHYYAGLPSRPILVARSSTTPWKAPTGTEAYYEKKLRPVFNHALSKVWGKLAPEVIALLDSMKVKFTSIDIVRIGIPGEEEDPFPVILWIGVMPASLSGDDGVVVASKCRGLLEKYDITDVDVEIRESIVWPAYNF